MADPKQLMAEGFSHTCSMCLKLWRSIDAGNSTCEAGLTGNECRGPMGGMDFPQYEGPLTTQLRTTTCFRCGIEAEFGLKVGGSESIIGVCGEHFDEFNLWRRSVEPKGYKTLQQKKIQFRV